MRNSICYILFVATMIAFQQLPHSCSTGMTGNFIEIPSSVTIEVENGVEMDAVFRCHHQCIDAQIGWLMNGSSSRVYPDVVESFVRDTNGTGIDTLTIPAIPEYNGTEVVCVATVFEESLRREVTPPANLVIIVIREAATQPPPTTIIEVVTPEVTTQPPPTTTMELGFVMTPSSLNKTVEQGEAIFHCQHRSSDHITWRVNGTSISSRDNISEWSVPVGDGHFVYFFSIATLPSFNNTTIECGAIFFDGSPLLFIPPVTLLIQDIPENVNNLGFERNYSSGTLTTFWDPLPTLDITDRDPDIIYRVQIFKIISGCRQSVLVSDENVTECITSRSPYEHMEIYMAVITPRNNVPGYIDGPTEERKEEFMHLKGTTLFELSRGRPKTIKSVLPVPRYYTMVLESLDGIGSNMQVNISVQRDGEMVTMQIEEPLPPRRLWTASILSYNCKADMPTAELSTHEIQNVVVTVNPSHPKAIQLKGNFVDGSEATGVLWMVYSLNNNSDILNQYIYIAKQPEQSSISMDVTGLTGTEYGVSSFALENGVPFLRVVTSPTNITVSAAYNDDRERIPQPLEYVLHPTSTGVCITCTFLESSTTDCVAVVHQRISQLSSSGLMNIESSHKFTRSGDTAYGCIEGVNLDPEQYQVGVIGGRRSIAMTHHTPSSPRSLYFIIGIVCAAVLAVVLVGTTLSVLLYCIKRFHSSKFRHSSTNPDHVSISPDEGGRPSLGESEVDVEMKRCAAYQVVQLSR